MKKIFLFTVLFCATLMAHAQYTPTAEELNEILLRIENKLTNIENKLGIPNGESNFAPATPNPTEIVYKTWNLEGYEYAADWTNTLTINLNRALTAGEKLKFSFDYSCSSPDNETTINEAYSTINYHKNSDFGSYMSSSNITFTPTEQHFEQTITPNEAGLSHIVFCLSHYRGACIYKIKNVCVYVEGTQDLLIDAKGNRNFVVSSSAQNADKPTVEYQYPGFDAAKYQFGYTTTGAIDLGYVSESMPSGCLSITNDCYLNFDNTNITDWKDASFSPFPLINVTKGKTYTLRYKMRGTSDQYLLFGFGNVSNQLWFTSNDWQEGELKFQTDENQFDSVMLMIDVSNFKGTFDIQYLELSHE